MALVSKVQQKKVVGELVARGTPSRAWRNPSPSTLSRLIVLWDRPAYCSLSSKVRRSSGVFAPLRALYRHIESRQGRGRMPPPRLPLPQRRYLPRSRVWGGPEERAGAWVSSPGYGFPRVSPRLPPPPGAGDASILRPGRREGDLTKPGYYPHFV